MSGRDHGEEFPWQRLLTILTLEAMERGEPVDLPDGMRRYIAKRLLPILRAEEAARRGRPGAPGAGEMVQAHIDGGMDPKAARRLVAKRTGLKMASVASAHRRFLETTDKTAMLYKVTEQPPGFPRKPPR